MRKQFRAILIAAAVFAAGCSSTFLVSKDGRGYFFGSDSNAIYRMLCESGDLKKILTDTGFSQKIKDDIYRYNCTAEKSGEKVKLMYASMSPEERKELRSAFKNNGYDINYLPC